MLIGNKNFNLDNDAYIMGILNVTPDSFSDGGNYTSIDIALKHAQKMIDEGVDIIDIGGESTRPGHEIVTAEEEIQRVIPVIEALVKITDIPISIDTSKAVVADAAIKAGASMINDVWGFKKDPLMGKVAAIHQVPVCLMHNRLDTAYNDLIEDMIEDLQESIDIAIGAGVAQEMIMLDPGIGFAKTLEDNLKVMQELEVFHRLGYPLLLGTSRKSMIGNALDLPVDERLEGTLATTVLGYMRGCCLFRVHDVKENARALQMTKYMR